MSKYVLQVLTLRDVSAMLFLLNFKQRMSESRTCRGAQMRRVYIIIIIKKEKTWAELAERFVRN